MKPRPPFLYRLKANKNGRPVWPLAWRRVGHLAVGVCLVGLLSACGLFSSRRNDLGVYVIQLKDVQRSAALEQPNKMFSTSQRSDGTTVYTYHDTQLKLEWTITHTRFEFTLENLSPLSLEIPWDFARYINPAADTLQVLHKGVDYELRAYPQEPTVIPPGGVWKDFLLPKDHITYEETNYWLWKITYLFYQKRENVGQHFYLQLPVNYLTQEELEAKYSMEAKDTPMAAPAPGVPSYLYTFHFWISAWHATGQR